MARKPQPTDFPVDVPDVGRFTFAKRRMDDEFAIQVAYARRIDGIQFPTDWLELVGTWLATLSVLTVRGPEGWNLEEMDPLDPDTYAKLKKVYDSLREKEQSFRPKPVGGSEG